ncbi:hypothetical protein CDD83_4914 [Cordyceps sp. RAO-2017]|nr:hypothetical protein CDD83_4914 [Cordyceps sp. RAO-2017]
MTVCSAKASASLLPPSPACSPSPVSRRHPPHTVDGRLLLSSIANSFIIRIIIRIRISILFFSFLPLPLHAFASFCCSVAASAHLAESPPTSVLAIADAAAILPPSLPPFPPPTQQAARQSVPGLDPWSPAAST